ncbi:MAG: hypothetical protein WA001_02550 [Patescibacteria group bacterium]
MRVTVHTSINLLTLSHAWNHSTALDAYKSKGHFALFLLEAMSRSSLPAFAYQGKKHPLQKTRRWYGKFDADLRAYYRAHSKTILAASKKPRCKEAKQFPTQLQNLIKTFGPYHPPCDMVVLCPNVFGIPGEGYGPLIGKTAFAIFTPNPKKDQTWLMVHEVCHSLLLPVFRSAKIRRLIRETASQMEKWSTKKFRTYYPKWEWLIEEYLIHAIEQYVTESSIKEKISWGMNRLPWFIRSWDAFQKRREKEPALNVGLWVRETLQTIAGSS